MSDEQALLDQIEQGIIAHGGDLGGWTRRLDGAIQLFDGRLTLRASIEPESDPGRAGIVHAHLLAQLPRYKGEVLDACILGIGDDRAGGIKQAAGLWIMAVAGPIKSFLDNKPVCMTCQAGVEGGDRSQGYMEGDYGLRGLRAFVGPALARGSIGGEVLAAIDEHKPWFRHAAESAAPRRVHLAKVSIVSQGREGWTRELEIDGHEVSHRDPDWPAGVEGPDGGYITRFAVFEFPRNSKVLARRAELERTIRHFAENFSRFGSLDDLAASMVAQGFHPTLIHEAESFATIAFGRIYFEPYGLEGCPTVIRARGDGRVQPDVPLMKMPAYSRGRAIAAQLRGTMPEAEFQALCFHDAQSQAILQIIEAHGGVDLRNFRMGPMVVADRDASEATIQAAIELQRERLERDRPGSAPASKPEEKPWWKFW